MWQTGEISGGSQLAIKCSNQGPDVVVCVCNPSYLGGKGYSLRPQRQKKETVKNKLKAQRAGGMTQVVENLSSKEEALSSILSTGKKCSNQVETHFTFVSSSLARASHVFLPITRGQEVHCPLLSSSFPWASISVPVSSRSGFQVSPCFLTYLIRTH
jgi:hypothetical protein